MSSLHGFINDATGKVLGLYMCEHECLPDCLEATRQILTNRSSLNVSILINIRIFLC